MRIKTNSPEEYRKALVLFNEMTGLPFYENISVDEYIKRYSWEPGDFVGISNTERYITSWRGWGDFSNFAYLWEVEGMAKVIKYMLDFSPIVIVKNVGSYTAEITKDGINVGCQKISFEKLDEIVEAANKIRNKN